MPPLVTIAIPTYRRLAYLQEAVASAQAQDYPTVEILVSDDGPTEVIGAWCQVAAKKDRRLRYQKNTRNLGLAGNWNALADAARGEFIVIIGDDDRLLPEFVSRLMALTESGTQVAFSNHYLIDERGVRLAEASRKHTALYHRADLPAGQLMHAERSVWQNAIPASASLLRVADVRRLRFKEDLNTPEIELFLRLAREGGKFVFTSEYLAEYRVHTGSATGTGLWSDRLARYLLPMAVTLEIEPWKRHFMEPLLVDAVGRCLAQGNLQGAREFLSNPYYPAALRGRPRGLSQRGCASLPAALGAPLYQALQGIWRVAQELKRP